MDVLAYGGSEPLAAILENRSITLYAVPDPCGTDSATQLSGFCVVQSQHKITARSAMESTAYGRRPALLRLLPRIVALPLKAVFQAVMIVLMMLFWLPVPDVLLLQVLMLRYGSLSSSYLQSYPGHGLA